MKTALFKKYITIILLFSGLLPAVNVSAQNHSIDSLLHRIHQLENMPRGIRIDTALIDLYYSVALEYYSLFESRKEQEYTKKALDLISESMNRRNLEPGLKRRLLIRQAEGYGKMGTSYSDISDFPHALESHFKALKIDESINNKRGILRDLYSLAITYELLGEYKKSLNYNFKALHLAKAMNEYKYQADLYSNIGGGYNYLYKSEKSLEYVIKGLHIFQNLGDTNGICFSYNNIGNAYCGIADAKLDKGISPGKISEYDTALEYYQKALELNRITGDQKFMAILQSNVATTYPVWKKFHEAERNLLSSLEIFTEIKELQGIMETHGYLSKLYSENNNHQAALEHYKKSIIAKDSIYNIEKAKKNIREEMDFEFERKEAFQKAEHEKEVVKLEAKNHLQRRTRNFIVTISMILLLFVIFGFVFFHNRKNLRLHEQFSRQLLLSQEKERQRISKELHDSIGQNILFIKNQMIKKNDLSLMPSVDETLEEVRAISKDLYPNQLEKYGLIAAVDALAEKVKETSDIFVSHDLEAFNTPFSSDQLINYYRIIQECVSNAMKHAGATALRISAEKIDTEIKLIIQDNGKGFDKTLIAKKSQRSFGLLNLEERAQYLKGKFELQSSPGKGTRCIFTLPV